MNHVEPRAAYVIAVFNHRQMLRQVVERACRTGRAVIVVDDGSTDQSAEVVTGMPGVRVVTLGHNQGKGAALLAGFAAAAQIADWAITVDADGQHDPLEADRLLAVAVDEPASPSVGAQSPRPIVIGERRRMVSPEVPLASRFGRGFSNFWVRASGGPRLTDSQSGYRLYPLPDVLQIYTRGRRFQYEVEVLARAGWLGIPVREVAVSVHYPPRGERVSHFRPALDFFRNAAIFTRLIAARLLIPRGLRARLVRRGAQCPRSFAHAPALPALPKPSERIDEP